MFDPVALQRQQEAPAAASAATPSAGSSGRDMAVRARAASRALQALPTSEVHRVGGAMGWVVRDLFDASSPFLQITKHLFLPMQRVAMLHRVADALLAHQDKILAENAKDMEEAQVGSGHVRL